MKRIIALITVFLLVCSFAFAETSTIPEYLAKLDDYDLAAWTAGVLQEMNARGFCTYELNGGELTIVASMSPLYTEGVKTDAIVHPKSATINPGLYTVGEDIPAGIYTAIGADDSMFSKWIKVYKDMETYKNSEYTRIISETIGNGDKFSKMPLEDGNIIYLEGVTILQEYTNDILFQ